MQEKMNKTITIISVILTVIIWLVFGITFIHLAKSKNPRYVEQEYRTDTQKENVADLSETEIQLNSAMQETQVEFPEEKTYTFTNAPEGYFEDALFIGDSRTVGISEYAKIQGASFFATTGMSVYNIQKEEVDFPEIGKIKLEQLLSQKTYGKIYVMLGINELGYKREVTVQRYQELLSFIQNKQPNAIIFIQANLHVTKKLSASDEIYNNANIDALNQEYAKLADNKTLFYIDVNPLFDDEEGNLAKENSSDNTHVYARCYKAWGEWIATQAIIK